METAIADLLALRRPPPRVELAVPAREYQLFAAEALAIRQGLLLADDVGLGKTVSAICGMLHADRLPAIVVCPTHMPRQWEAYLHRFAPDLKVHVVRKGAPYPLTRQPRQRTLDLWPDRLPDVIVLNYHKLRGWAETLAELARFVVFDECQALRSPGTAIHAAARLIATRAAARLGLSATPIYNYGTEFFHVVDVLVPGALGEYDEFVREWCGEEGRLKDSKQFGGYLRREGIMLRRTREDVGRELPALTKMAHEIEADTDVLEKLQGDAVQLARVILAQNERYRGEKMQAAGEFDALMRQATGVAKAPYVAEFVRILVEGGERVVLFGWHREVYNIWLERLADLNPVMYTGTESTAQKDAAKAAFIEGDARVLIMSLRSGAGVDGLQHACSTAVFGELDWSPGVHEQCIGRVHRDGQEKPVMSYYLISTEGSDPIVSDVLGIKREQIEGVRNPSIGMAERIETGENHIRRLAAEFLAARGAAPEPTARSVVPLRSQEEETTA
jgi:SNF2 family DNA or RNA helicase